MTSCLSAQNWQNLRLGLRWNVLFGIEPCLLAGPRVVARPNVVVRISSERGLVVELPTAGVAGRVGRPVTTAAAAAAAAAAAGRPLDLGGGELEAWSDLVGLDLGDRALLALRGLPGTLPQPADHDAPGALLEGLGDVLGLLPPDVDPEERRLAVLPAVAFPHPGGHGQAEVGHGGPVGGEPQLRVVGQVPDQHDLVVDCHQYPSLASRAGCLPGTTSRDQAQRASGEGDVVGRSVSGGLRPDDLVP